MTVRVIYAPCSVLSNKVCFVCWCHNIDKSNPKQYIPMCSSDWSRLSAVFVWFVCCLLAVINSVSTTLYYIHPRRINTPDGPTRVHYRMETLYGLFVESCWLFILSNMIVLWRKRFSQKCFLKSRMAMRNPKNIWEKGVGKGQVVQPNVIGWDWLEYVEWDRWDRWDRDMEVSILGGTGWDWDREVFRLCGTGSWDRGLFRLVGQDGTEGLPTESVHLSQSGTT